MDIEGQDKKNKLVKRHFSLTTIGFIIILIAILGMGVFTLAKYVLSWREDALVEAAGFYFDSDYLCPAPENAKYNIYDWSSGFKVELYNKENGNTSAVDINYDILVDGGILAEVNSVAIISSTTYDIPTTQVDAEILTITPVEGAKVGDSVMVVVHTAPYDKPLKAKFVLQDAGKNSIYQYKDKGSYGELIIKTGQNLPTSILWNETKLAHDNTNPLMSGASDGSCALIGLNSNAVYNLNFFENIAQDYGNTGEFLIGDTMNSYPINLTSLSTR